MRILFLIADLDHGGQARQLCLLAAHLPADRFQARVVVLGGPSPWAEQLHQAGLTVDLLGWRRAFDLAPFLALSRLLQDERPDAIHVWGTLALRGLCLAGGPRGARVFLTGLLPPLGRPGWLDRWLWGRRSRIVSLGESEAARYRQFGLAAERIAVVWPAVLPASSDGSVGSLAGLPESSRVVLAVGPFRTHKGYKEAVWTLDILHYLYPDLHLVLVGEGPEGERLQRFSRLLHLEERVHFTGACVDVGPWYRRAELVWVPALGVGGVNVALEAQAAGKAVVGSRVPALAEIIGEGQTGLLARPGDKPDLARQTRRLLDDPARCRVLGEGGPGHVAQRFRVAGLVERATELYVGN